MKKERRNEETKERRREGTEEQTYEGTKARKDGPDVRTYKGMNVRRNEGPEGRIERTNALNETSFTSMMSLASALANSLSTLVDSSL